MGVLPIYMGVKGEENAGLTVSFLYFAMNKNASEKDQKATKQFLDYILNDDEARDIITNEAGFETPFTRPRTRFIAPTMPMPRQISTIL